MPTATKTRKATVITKLNNLPRDLRHLTPEQRTQVVDFYKTKTLKELRKRQWIARQQKGLGQQQENELVVSNMDITEDLLIQAVNERYCPDPSPT